MSFTVLTEIFDFGNTVRMWANSQHVTLILQWTLYWIKHYLPREIRIASCHILLAVEMISDLSTKVGLKMWDVLETYWHGNKVHCNQWALKSELKTGDETGNAGFQWRSMSPICHHNNCATGRGAVENLVKVVNFVHVGYGIKSLWFSCKNWTGSMTEAHCKKFPKICYFTL